MEKGSLQERIRELAEESGAESVSLFIIEGGSLVCRAGYGRAEKLVDQAIYNINVPKQKTNYGLTAWIAKHGKPITFNSLVELQTNQAWQGKYDLWQYPNHWNDYFKNLLAFPIKEGEELTGLIKVENYSVDKFNAEHLSNWLIRNSNLLKLNPRYSEIAELFVDESLGNLIELPKLVLDVSLESWDTLLRYLKEKPEDIYNFTPRKFEELIAELLDRQGFEVTLTGETRDRGRDILAYKKSEIGNHLYLVECKKYAPHNPVGISIVRQLYGVVEADRATAGIICTSSRFTRDAEIFASSIRHRMSLRDYNHLIDWISRLA